jgi:hypothetical protein
LAQIEVGWVLAADQRFEDEERDEGAEILGSGTPVGENNHVSNCDDALHVSIQWDNLVSTGFGGDSTVPIFSAEVPRTYW